MNEVKSPPGAYVMADTSPRASVTLCNMPFASSASCVVTPYGPVTATELEPYVRVVTSVFEARRVLSRKGPCAACRRRRVIPLVEDEA